MSDNTQYAPTVTTPLTPEEAAEQVLAPPASQIDRRQPAPESGPVENVSEVKERYLEGDHIVEVVNEEVVEEPSDSVETPLEEYTATVQNNDADFMATTEREEIDVTK